MGLLCKGIGELYSYLLELVTANCYLLDGF